VRVRESFLPWIGLSEAGRREAVAERIAPYLRGMLNRLTAGCFVLQSIVFEVKLWWGGTHRLEIPIGRGHPGRKTAGGTPAIHLLFSRIGFATTARNTGASIQLT
jgi:hypothetical protein